MKKEYLLEQIKRVEDIIKEGREKEKNNILKGHTIKTFKESGLQNTLKEITQKYDYTKITYLYFKHRNYNTFKKEILLAYLEDLVSLAFKLNLLDNTFTY